MSLQGPSRGTVRKIVKGSFWLGSFVVVSMGSWDLEFPPPPSSQSHHTHGFTLCIPSLETFSSGDHSNQQQMPPNAPLRKHNRSFKEPGNGTGFQTCVVLPARPVLSELRGAPSTRVCVRSPVLPSMTMTAVGRRPQGLTVHVSPLWPETGSHGRASHCCGRDQVWEMFLTSGSCLLSMLIL